MNFGFNLYAEGRSIDWQLASQGAAFVYLGADKVCQQAAKDALEKTSLLVGAYWSLESSIDPSAQADLFISRLPEKTSSSLPPAVWVYSSKQTLALKTFVEVFERKTKRTLVIGGTPDSLSKAGAIFGRTNPLWISHKPVYGGPKIPAGWSEFFIWQTETSGSIKGVSGTVGFNGSQAYKKISWGWVGAVAVGAALYYAGTKHK